MRNYNYRPQKPKKQIDFNPKHVVIGLLVLTVLNIFFMTVTGVDWLSIISLAACIIGLVYALLKFRKPKEKGDSAPKERKRK
ncbi:hypothetical protein [Anaerolentibacter hominis]|uniref:hypothetical protein n=1 Tax=Anaerolentibacter hominis TaxID=3079009 RepID=UPI0031B81EC3